MGLLEKVRHLWGSFRTGRKHSCGRKINYKSEESAKKAADKMNRKKEAAGDDKRLEAYPCFWCHGWHIGGSIEYYKRRKTGEGQKTA